MRFLVTISFIIVIIYGFSTTLAVKRGKPSGPGGRRPTRPLVRRPRTRWYTCNFENGFCGWRNDSTAEFQWYRTANETPTDETGPRWDHTRVGVRGGHYLYIETSVPRLNGDHARLISPVLVEQGIFCLKFWHSMHGTDVKDLNVHIKGRISKKLTTISHLSGPWSVGSNIRNLQGEDNDWWNQESLEFVVREPANIIFEGVRGKNYRGDIAIDDIALKKGRCPRQSIDCDFEKNTCGWTQMSGDEFNWLPNRESTQTKNTGPSHDHTLQNPHGRYLYIETSWPRVEGDKARLASPKITCDKGAHPVFTLWYNMNGVHMAPLKVYATRDKARLGDPIWEQAGDHQDKWLLCQAAIPESLILKGFFYIVIEAERNDYQGDAAIDDVSLVGCYRSEPFFGKLSFLTTPTTKTPAKTTPAATVPWLHVTGEPVILPAGIDCDFDQGLPCSWTQDDDDQFDWEFNQGQTHSESTGPASDHTTRKGWYLYVEASSPRRDRDQAVLRTPVINPTIVCCVSFYYHMQGKEMGKLELLSVARDGFRFKKHWFKQGEQSQNDTDWRLAKVDVRDSVPYQIAFRATIGVGFFSDIAIDDIKVVPKPCEVSTPMISSTSSATSPETKSPTKESFLDSMGCDFSGSSFCGWNQVGSTEDEFDWTVADSKNTPSGETGPVVDHTAGSSGGFVYIEASTPRSEGDRAMLTSSVYEVKKTMCFRFWYHMYGEGTGNLTVYRKVLKTGKLIPLWSSGGNKGNLWLQGHTNLRKLGDVVLIIEATRGEFWSGDIAIDDIDITEGECPEFNCGFEEGSCAWVQDSQQDDFNWTMHRGSTKSKNTGPDFDHTLKNENGTYLYIEASSPRQRYDKARIVSPIIDPGLKPAKCLTFWFHSFGDHVGSINVYKKAAGTNETYLGSPLWVKARNEGNQWVYAKKDINDELPYQIVIEGIRGLDYLGDIAIDDIEMTDGACDPCCDDTKFKCGNNFCIPKSIYCNAVDDCGDGSDESFCSEVIPCGTPHVYAPLREHMDISHAVLHDEGLSDLFNKPMEGEALPTKKAIVGAQQIFEWQWSLLKHGIPRVAVDPGLYSEDIQFTLNVGRKPETFSVERRKRNAEMLDEFKDDNKTSDDEVEISSEENKTSEENFKSIDLIQIQENEKKIEEVGVESVSKLERKLVESHKEKRRRIQASVGKHHTISQKEWKLMKKSKKLSRAGREKRSLNVKKIVGGTKSSQYNYPWQVAYYITDSGTKSHYFCGATLVYRYWIITAAHCPHLGDVHNVVIGDYDLYTDEGTEQEIIVDAIFIHHQYKFDEDLVKDIALIKLRYPAKQSKSVQLACVLGKRDEPFDDGHICVSTGWGRVDAQTPGIERYLRQTEMPIVSNSLCKLNFWSIYKFHDSYVCAGGTGGNSCRGDSGGPLMCKKDDKFYLVGITSWGDTRCKAYIPGVYTRVQSYNKWIDNIMEQQKCKPQ